MITKSLTLTKGEESSGKQIFKFSDEERKQYIDEILEKTKKRIEENEILQKKGHIFASRFIVKQ